MTPKERWVAVLSGSSADRAPRDYWGTGEITARLLADLDCPDERALWKRLNVDKLIHLAPRHPRSRESTWHLQSHFSLWGIGTRAIEYSSGVYEEAVHAPLAAATTVAEVERFPWPDPCEWDVSHLRAECAAWADHPILCGTSEMFYLYSRLRGMEQALVDLVENPAIVDCALEHIEHHDRTVLTRILQEAGDLIQFVYVAEDLGTQESLLMSPRHFRRFLKPRMARMIALAHACGVKVFHHDDGAIRPLIPELLDIGIDLLNPIQWRCPGLDRAELRRSFGEHVVFHGAIDNQQTLPFGTPADVRREVEECRALLGDRYVIAPCHNLQANTPTANVLALYEAD